VPIARGATLEDALYGGEDYELLFTTPVKKKIPLPVIRIGTIGKGSAGEVRFQGKRIQARGFEHFQ
jgi:thiamine-monophosphate kinase